MRRTAGLSAALLLALFLTACGDESTTDGSERKPDAASEESPRLNPRTASFAVLDDARAELALLSQGNLGSAFEADTSSGDDEPVDPAADTATGCEADVSFEDRLDPDGVAIGDADIDYWLVDDVRLMVVTSKVSSFGDEATAEAAFGALYDDIDGCTHFEDSSEDGTESTVIDVTVDTETATDDVDDQFAMVGGGTWSFEGQEVPLGVGFSIARIDSNVTMVMLLSIGVTEDNELLAPYTEIAADRLVQVAADQVPVDVPAPLPSSTPPVRVPIERTPTTIEQFLASAPGILGG
ncbi:MAG: hypothetical protein JHC95_16045 [Solirubrobacteraceae bacterium]|nr:hypothetical protein [Solirubrobacteraceae bacterium]